MTGLVPVAAGAGTACRQGAHVLQWRTPDGEQGLFLSRKSQFAAGVPIRGGIPVVFPWFGDDPERRGRPAHGFARRVDWQLDWAASDCGQGILCFALRDDEGTRASWPHAFRCALRASLGRELEVSLSVHNAGAVAFRFEAALHTYLRVGDVRQVTVRGLGGATFVDKLAAGGQRGVQTDDELRLLGETDRVYVGSAATCRVVDPVLRRTLAVAKTGAPSTVLWNPWSTKTARLQDLGADEWPQFVCVESGCVGDDAVVLEPQQSHCLAVRIASEV